jgi:hypothetical protein
LFILSAFGLIDDVTFKARIDSYQHAQESKPAFFSSTQTAKPHLSIIRQPSGGAQKMNRTAQLDNSGRRSGADRRQFSYAVHIPERRMDDNRRNMDDRRHKPRP